MKKLMTVLASAATALFAIGVAKGDGFTHKAGFESYQAGQKLDLTLNDSGENASPRYWYTSSAEDAGDISNHVGEAIAEALIPDGFESEGSKYLHIDTSAPLFRHVSAETEGATATPVAIGDGIYLDTLVQFTAADDEFQTDLDSGDKIAISYVEHEDDATTTDVNEAWTNFVIRAGAIVDEEFDQANYFATVPAGFNKDDWHRLTVRTIADVGDGQVGFIIYLDGDQTKALSFTNAVETGFTSENLNTLAKEYFDKNALYPSAVNSGTDKATISAASFSGTGALDDVVFTATKPSFIQEAAQVTITWDEGFTAVTIDGTAVTAEELAAKTKTVPLVGGTVLVTYTLASGYEEGAFSSTWDSTLGGFTGLEGGATCELKSMLPKFDVGGVHYDTFATALAAAVAAGTSASPATIKLLANVDNVVEFTTGYVVLDLAGKTITDGANDGAAIVNSGATLTIINSTEDIGHVVANGAGAAVVLTGGSTVITGGAFDGAVSPDSGILSITGGQFLDVEEAGDAEYWGLTGYVDGGASNITYDSETTYFIIGGGVVPPTTYALTIPEVTGATAIAKINGTEVTDLTKIAENAEVVVTWTAAEGYKITAGATETITMSGNKTAAAPTVVAITYVTLTITPIENCTIVVSNATEEVASGAKFDVDDGVTLTVYRTPAEGYELDGCTEEETIVMTADRTVTAAVKESGSQPGEKTYPEYIDESAKKSYDEWAQYAGIMTDEAFADADKNNLEAYLLNCKLDEVADAKAAFKFTSISYDAEQSKWVTTTTTSYNERAYNGTVEVKSYSDVGCKTPSETGSFFKAELK